ncbi:hypothetical protein [Paenibacillus sp. S150]|uniref:hypothetical protein n=1 Tax=Paenibacillus sp. S150 TaxID=2749826 RepID=UPI0035C9CF90
MTNSPLPDKWCLDESSALFQPLNDLFEEGQKQKLSKQAGVGLLITYCMYPVMRLVKERFKGETQIDGSPLKIMLQMSWDAVKA